jgi:hypothetical protein
MGRARHNIGTAAWAGEWDKALPMLLAGIAGSKPPVSPAEHDELSALLPAIGQAVSRLAASRICGAQPRCGYWLLANRLRMGRQSACRNRS